MKRKFLLLALFATFVVPHAMAEQAERITKSSEIINNKGEKMGEISLVQGTKGVLITIKASGLTPGYHGMHFHSVGDCSDHHEFQHAKGHVDPHKKPHGYLHPEGPHEGNLPNLVVAKDGTVEAEHYSELVSLTAGDANLLDSDGSAFIIHAQKDDHITQPIGGSGARVGCAVIR